MRREITRESRQRCAPLHNGPNGLRFQDFGDDGAPNPSENRPGRDFSCPSGLLEVHIRVVIRYRSTVGVANAVAAGTGITPLPSTFL
jgi:hypothetical protein